MPATSEDVPGLAEVLAPEGWPNASSAPVGADDPGRYNCLFGRVSLITSLAVLTFIIVMIVSFSYIRFVGGNLRGLAEE